MEDDCFKDGDAYFYVDDSVICVKEEFNENNDFSKKSTHLIRSFLNGVG